MRRSTLPAGRPTAGIRSFKRSTGHSLRWKRPLTRMAGDGPTSPKSQRFVREENMKRLITAITAGVACAALLTSAAFAQGKPEKPTSPSACRSPPRRSCRSTWRKRQGFQEGGPERRDRRVPWWYRLGARHDRRRRRRRRDVAGGCHCRHRGRPADERVLRRLQHGSLRLVCGRGHQEHGGRQGQALRHFPHRLVDRLSDPLRA